MQFSTLFLARWISAVCAVTIILILLSKVDNPLWSYIPENSVQLTSVKKYSCEDEKMSFTSFLHKKPVAAGRNFSCDLIPFLEEWEISDHFHYEEEAIDESEVVFVTYASSNHFKESRAAIRSMRDAFPNRIIYYDIGLERTEREELANVCNLELRSFHFDKYPHFVLDLKAYHFKPIIMAEVFREFKHYWFIDASLRFSDIKPYLSEFYSKINSGSMERLVLRQPNHHSVFSTTHPKMYEYLPIEKVRAQREVMLEANTIFVSRSDFSREVIKWVVLCALTADCNNPPGAVQPCFFEGEHYKKYNNCHRYDQSDLNIVLLSLLDRDGWARSNRMDRAMSIFTRVARDEVDDLPLWIPCSR